MSRSYFFHNPTVCSLMPTQFTKKKPTQKELKMLPSDKTVTMKHFLFQGEQFKKNVSFVKIRLQQKILCNVHNNNCYLYGITDCGDNKN